MLYFIMQVIVVSIVGWIVLYAVKFIPHRMKFKYSLFMNLLSTGLITLILTCLFIFEIYPSWINLFALTFVPLLFSAWLTKYVAQKKGEAVGKERRVEGSPSQS